MTLGSGASAAQLDHPIGLAEPLIQWIETALDGRLVHAERQPGGGSREAWFIDVAVGDQLLPLFLRYDAAAPDQSAEPFTLHDEARVYAALENSPVPTPQIRAVHPTLQAIVMSRIAGSAWFSRLDDEHERVQIASEFMRILAALHQVDPVKLTLPGQDASADLRDLVGRELRRWETLYRSGDRPDDPVIELAIHYLSANVPDVSGPVAIIQGDTGPGNFMFENGKITAVLDWELAHLGDPHDDLAWVTQRALQEPFTHMPARLADYEQAAGFSVDRERIWYYRIFASTRILILAHSKPDDSAELSDVGTLKAFMMLHRRTCLEGLAHANGVELPVEAETFADETRHSWLYDAALAQVSEVIVPRSTDPFVIRRAKGLARLLKHLQQVDRYGAAVDEAFIAETGAFLSCAPGSAAEADAFLSNAVDAVDQRELIALLYRQTLRQQQLLRPAMGVLADRHYDPLGDEG